ncbi:hypothetical protein I6A84_19855 [Frankia sp. CNm7]|uniref:Anti-sigma factor n=1 Tax=Frankia nepalensis TaxID=1836974 RepID=A0A937UQU3_9ACTN|nr:hypothetical protein [Frankia nepalensis]MBL7497122.1 hypothetical protein [Frankia nepalensis]MBL7510149.1 hypothetical protein [Frankia nepalensis]MBL7520280.1 hypothetical protein [Frankia nepalensis]MBL7627076.1 hypothetical protein [Frankia nepalensis]
MRHPADGTLRRLVDDPVGVGDADREHVARCPVCLSGLAAASQDAAATGTALDVDPDVDLDLDVDAAWRRLSRAVAARERPRVPASAPVPRWRAALRSPVVAAVGVLALLAGAGAAAAADWVQVFRTERIAPLAITQADLVALPDLSAYGTVEQVADADVREVADAAAAEEAAGLPAPRVGELPRGVTGEPTFRVGDQLSMVFTFSAEKAARAAEAAGEPLPPPPAGLDGSQFRLVAGPGLAAVWGASRGVPTMIAARAVAPTAYSSGVPFETARDYLLSLPGLPADVASGLRSFSGDGTTLPLPVPAEEMTSSTADVGGAPATVLTSRDGAMVAVVWVEDGVVTAVAGSLSSDEALSVARGLRRGR